MPDNMKVYLSATSATPSPVAGPVQQLHQMFAWLGTSTPARRPGPYVSEELAAEIREALAAVERGETEDLGSFAQYADEDDDHED